ncbi:acyl-CoA synthetase [Marininema halotolerans]|uniref:Acetyl-CoA synthetase n=1 Tax=Marininema halotolerans TaxID=1155944 RepID=A0A1I6RQE1_9BACL|nr:acyl--CoA ligase [Marininema halotolerans]SFS66905.1 acetyl-CoA synthetase [Marininema halotolerans]
MKMPEYYNMTHDIDRHAHDPMQVALRWENEQGVTRMITYRELKQRSDQLAQGFLASGLKKGDRIFILLPRVPEATMTYMGALKAGLTIIPGSEMLRPDDIRYRIEHGEVKAVVFDASLENEVLQGLEGTSTVKMGYVLGETRTDQFQSLLRIGHGVKEQPLPKTRWDDVAFISYTSGTTGGPKGVIHVHGWAIPHQQVAAKEWMDIRKKDTVWATAGPGWAKWVWSPFISTLGSGATALAYQGRFYPEKTLSLIEKYHVNVLCCTPTEYRLMAKVDGLERYNLSDLRSAVSAGEPLNGEVINTFRRYFQVDVRDGYGQTENTLLVATMKGMKVKAGSMGKPTTLNQVEIIDEEGEWVPVGQVGDIAIHEAAPGLFKGYYKDPERTANAFRGEWYLTGDRARKDEDGYFWFEGRGDDIIISAGYTIGPFEVEDALVKHPLVQECAVVASPDSLRGSVVKAFIVLKDGQEQEGSDSLMKELQTHVKSLTAPYKYPRVIEFVTTLPKTSSGKIRRIQLREQEMEGFKHIHDQ